MELRLLGWQHVILSGLQQKLDHWLGTILFILLWFGEQWVPLSSQVTLGMLYYCYQTVSARTRRQALRERTEDLSSRSLALSWCDFEPVPFPLWASLFSSVHEESDQRTFAARWVCGSPLRHGWSGPRPDEKSPWEDNL